MTRHIQLDVDSKIYDRFRNLTASLHLHHELYSRIVYAIPSKVDTKLGDQIYRHIRWWSL